MTRMQCLINYLHDLNELYTRNDMNSQLGSAVTLMADKITGVMSSNDGHKNTIEHHHQLYAWN